MKRIRTCIIASALLLPALAGSGPSPFASGLDDAASACAACHKGKRSFAGRDAADLAAAIRAIRDGKIRHPKLGLAADSDEAIDELAARLATD